MGCSSSSPRSTDRDEGICVIEIIKCEHLPNMDVGSLTDAYVKCRFIDTIDPNIHDSVKLKTSVQWNSLNPVYHAFLAFPLFPNEADTVEFKIVDEDVMNANDDIGRAEVQFTHLLSRIGEEVKLDVRLKKNLKSVDGEPTTITVRLVKLSRNEKPKKIRKEFFVIRHGESIWNESQEGKSVKGMVSQYDHELTKLGISQAQDFNERWNEVKKDPKLDKDGDLKAFLSASSVFSSPLTRATQTALLTCKGHPSLLTDPLVLLRNLREVKNFGSFDTVGQYTGTEIESNVKDKLLRDLGDEADEDLLDVEIDPFDAFDCWWTPLQQKEKKEHVKNRFTELWAYLRYGTHAQTAILVGHSHFFRHMCKEHMSPEFRKRDPEWTNQLDKSKLDNGGCLRVTVEWDGAKGPMEPPVIHAARLVFGSKLAGSETGTEDGGNSDADVDTPTPLSPFSRPSMKGFKDYDVSGIETGSNSISASGGVDEASADVSSIMLSF